MLRTFQLLWARCLQVYHRFQHSNLASFPLRVRIFMHFVRIINHLVFLVKKSNFPNVKYDLDFHIWSSLPQYCNRSTSSICYIYKTISHHFPFLTSQHLIWPPTHLSQKDERRQPKNLYSYTDFICPHNKCTVSHNTLHNPFVYYLFVILKFLNLGDKIFNALKWVDNDSVKTDGLTAVRQ